MKMDRMEEIVRSAGLDPAAFRALPEARRLALIRAAGILGLYENLQRLGNAAVYRYEQFYSVS